MRQHLNEEQLQQAIIKLLSILTIVLLAGLVFFLSVLAAAGIMLIKLVP